MVPQLAARRRRIFSAVVLVGILLGAGSVASAKHFFFPKKPAAAQSKDAGKDEGLAGAPVDPLQPGGTVFRILMIAGALASGVVLGYHPHYRGRVGSLDEMDLPKISITYTVIGGLVGILVEINDFLGFAIFGIGGLMRFRTLLSSAKETGRLILATMIGIAWGVGEWPMAIGITALAWVLVLILDWRVGYRMVIRGVDDTLDATVEAYRDILVDLGCRISQIKQNPKKGQVTFVFKASRRYSRDAIQDVFEEDIPAEVRGTIDWTEEV